MEIQVIIPILYNKHFEDVTTDIVKELIHIPQKKFENYTKLSIGD